MYIVIINLWLDVGCWLLLVIDVAIKQQLCSKLWKLSDYGCLCDVMIFSYLRIQQWLMTNCQKTFILNTALFTILLNINYMPYFVTARPAIVTTTPTATQIPGADGEQVDLTCIGSSKPSPSLSWKRQLNGDDLNSLNDNKVKSITVQKDTSVLKVTVSTIGEKFYCVAVNFLGRDTQEYTIRERGMLW